MTSPPNGLLISRSAFFAVAAGLVLAACGGAGGASPVTAPAVPASSAVPATAAVSPPSSAPAAASATAEPAIADPAIADPATASVIPAALVGATTIDGAAFDADALAGRPTVAWFWAPWCVICRGEAPDVVDVVSRYSDRVNFVGVAGRGEAAEMREFVADTGTGSFIHLDDSSGEIWASYEIFAQPAFAFITDDGRLETFTGSLGVDELVAIVDQLLVA